MRVKPPILTIDAAETGDNVGRGLPQPGVLGFAEVHRHGGGGVPFGCSYEPGSGVSVEYPWRNGGRRRGEGSDTVPSMLRGSRRFARAVFTVVLASGGLLVASSGSVSAATVVDFTTVGAGQTFQVPDGVTSMARATT